MGRTDFDISSSNIAHRMEKPAAKTITERLLSTEQGCLQAEVRTLPSLRSGLLRTGDTTTIQKHPPPLCRQFKLFAEGETL